MPPESRVHTRDLINRGNALLAVERYMEATELLKEAKKVANENGYTDEEIQSLLSLSACYYHISRSEVEPTLSRALALAISSNDLVAAGKCYLNLSNLVENKLQAAAQLRLALQAFETSQHEIGIAQALDNLAVCYRAIGSPRLAAFYAGRAQALFHKINNPLGLAMSLKLGADLMTDAADAGLEPASVRDRARMNYVKAMHLFREINAPTSFATCLDALGLLEQQNGNLEVAIEHHERAIRIFEDCGTLHPLSSALLHLANSCRASGRVHEALSLFVRIIQLKNDLGDNDGALNTLHNRAVMLSDIGDYSPAQRDLLIIIQSRFQQARSIYLPHTRTGHLENYSAASSSYIFATYRLMGAPANYSDAIAIQVKIEQSKFNVAGRGMSIVRDADIAVEKDRIRTLRRELLLRKRYRALSLNGTRLKTDLGNKTITQASYNRAMHHLTERGYSTVNSLHKLYAKHPPTIVDTDFKSYCSKIERAVNEAISNETSSNTILLHLFQFEGRDELLAAAVTKDHGHVSSISLSKDSFGTMADDYRNVQSTPPGIHWEYALSALSDGLGQLLEKLRLGPLLNRNQPLVIVASSIWHSMPWQIAAVSSGYRGIQCAVTRNLSLTSLPSKHQRLLIASQDPRSREAHLYCPSNADLRSNRKEVDAIAMILERRDLMTSLFMDSDASSYNFINKTLRTRPDIFHFVGHSDFDLVDAGLSNIFLQSRNSAIANAAMTAAEIEALHTSRGPRLVYLSSCKSATSEVLPGDEPIGLVKAFLSSGTNALVATSWSTLDSSAADMSVAFYEALVAGNTVAESVRQARHRVLSLASAGRYPEKATFIHWGPIISFGDPQFRLIGRY